MSVFLSHSFEDSNRVQEIREQLEKERIDVWKLWNLREGYPLAEELREAITGCDVCVFVATANSIASPWCNAEVGAFWGRQKPVIVYLDDSADRSSLPPQVRGNLHVSKLADLARAVRGMLSDSMNPTPPQYYPESSDYGGNAEWKKLLTDTQNRFDVMGISLDGWRRTPGVASKLVDKAKSGCRVRILMMHQDNVALEQTIKPEDGASDFRSHRETMKQSYLFYEKLARQDANIELRQIVRGCPHGSLTLTENEGLLVHYFYHINWANGPLWRSLSGSKLYEQCLTEFEHLWRLNAG